MIIKTDKNVEITIYEESLIKSIAYIRDMLEFAQESEEVKGEGAVTMIENLVVAIETMEAFWCDHFAESDQNTEKSVANQEKVLPDHEKAPDKDTETHACELSKQYTHCDVCIFNPPSSMHGKTCSTCLEVGKGNENG